MIDFSFFKCSTIVLVWKVNIIWESLHYPYDNNMSRETEEISLLSNVHEDTALPIDRNTLLYNACVLFYKQKYYSVSEVCTIFPSALCDFYFLSILLVYCSLIIFALSILSVCYQHFRLSCKNIEIS